MPPERPPAAGADERPHGMPVDPGHVQLSAVGHATVFPRDRQGGGHPSVTHLAWRRCPPLTENELTGRVLTARSPCRPSHRVGGGWWDEVGTHVDNGGHAECAVCAALGMTVDCEVGTGWEVGGRHTVGVFACPR